MPWIEIGIVTVVFAYAAWTIVRHVRKSKQGACASCSMKKSCTTGCGTMPTSSDTDTTKK